MRYYGCVLVLGVWGMQGCGMIYVADPERVCDEEHRGINEAKWQVDVRTFHMNASLDGVYTGNYMAVPMDGSSMTSSGLRTRQYGFSGHVTAYGAHELRLSTGEVMQSEPVWSEEDRAGSYSVSCSSPGKNLESAKLTFNPARFSVLDAEDFKKDPALPFEQRRDWCVIDLNEQGMISESEQVVRCEGISSSGLEAVEITVKPL